MKTLLSIVLNVYVLTQFTNCNSKVLQEPIIIPDSTRWGLTNLADSLGGCSKLVAINPRRLFLTGGYRKEPYTPVLVRSFINRAGWEVISLRPPTVAGFSNISPIDSSLIFAIGTQLQTQQNTLFKSQDQGQSWLPINGNLPSEGTHAFVFLDSNRGITQFNNGLMVTQDGGQHWTIAFQEEPNYRNFDHILFVNQQIGFAAGGIFSDDSNLGAPTFNQGAILRTKDSGQTWQKNKSDFARINTIFFLSGQTGYVTTQSQELWRTLSGGDNWELITSSLPVVPTGIHFFSQQEAILIGNSKKGNGIYATQDGGKTWSREYSTNQFSLIDLLVISHQVIYVLGTDCRLLSLN